MSVITYLELNALEQLVRNGLQPDNPPVLIKYILKAESEVNTSNNVNDKRRIFKRVLQTLMNTVCDTYVAYHWRCLCLDNMYKPLHAFERLSVSEQDKADVLRFRYELNVLSRYFL